MTSKRGKNQRFKAEKSVDNFAGGLMVFTLAYKSLTKAFKAICAKKKFFGAKTFFLLFFVMKNPRSESGSELT